MTATRTLTAVERHPQYSQILDAMAADQSDQQIAKWLRPPLDRTTLWRFRKTKLTELMQRRAQGPATAVQALQDMGILKDTADVNQAVRAVVAATTASLAADPFIARVEKLRAEREKVKGMALEGDKPDLRAWASLDKNDLSELELHAQLTGRLNTQSGPSVAIQIVCPAGSEPQVRADDEGVTVDITPGR